MIHIILKKKEKKKEITSSENLVESVSSKKTLIQKYKFLIRFLLKTLFLVVAVFLINQFVATPHRVRGNDMFPSIRDGDLGIFYKLDDCTINDIILYKTVAGDLRVGRVVAVGKQSVNFQEDGGLELDSYATLEEIPYDTFKAENSSIKYPYTVSKDSYFVLNDFRSVTTDSREFGEVKKSDIQGKLFVLFRRRGF